MGFPRSRFQQAGASQPELDALEAEHQALPGNMQAWNEQSWAGMDTEGLRQALDVRRSHGIELPEAESTEQLDAGTTVTVNGEEIPGAIATTEKPLEDLTVKQLREHAAANDIDLPAHATKAEILDILNDQAQADDELDAAGDSDDGDED